MSGTDKVTEHRPFGFLPLGTKTRWGTIEGVTINADGERYYFMIDRNGDVAFLPAATVEDEE